MTKTNPAPPSAARDHGLDDTLRDTFPASDPPSTIPDPEPADDPPLPRRAPPPPVPARRWTDRLGEQRAELLPD